MSVLNNYGFPRYPNGVPSGLYPSVAQNQKLEYVHGIEGANAYQMPFGVTKVILWDNDVDSFYIKIIDEMGRPRVVAWKDFVDHVEPEPKESSPVDMGKYVTKEDLAGLMTKTDFEKVLSELMVGVGGKVVRSNELNQ